MLGIFLGFCIYRCLFDLYVEVFVFCWSSIDRVVGIERVGYGVCAWVRAGLTLIRWNLVWGNL